MKISSENLYVDIGVKGLIEALLGKDSDKQGGLETAT